MTTPISTLTSLLSTLISFKTVSHDHEANETAIQWIQSQLASYPLHVTVLRNHGFPAVIATTQRTRTPKLWLQAHLDIVPGSDNAYTATVKDDRLYGRGSFDMKFAIAAYIQLIHDLGDNLSTYDFGLMITTDEELGGENGVKALLDQGYHSQAVLLPDGGKNWQFVSASRGIWHVRVNSTGESQHGSRPWLGQNAITPLVQFLAELPTLFPAEPCDTPNHFHDSYSIGLIQGGQVINQIPDQASASLDIRFLPDHQKTLQAAVTKLAHKHSVALETIAFGHGYHVDSSNSYFKNFEHQLHQHHLPTSFEITHGSSDARYFAEHQIPAIVLRPRGGGHHSENEWIDLNDLATFQSILHDFVIDTTIKS